MRADRTGRLFKKTVQQGRSECRAEAYPLGYVEGLNDARTMLAGFFNSVLACASAVEHKGDRPVVHQFDLHMRGKDPSFHASAQSSQLSHNLLV